MVYKRTLRCKEKILVKERLSGQVLQEIGLILAEIPQAGRISNISWTASKLSGSPAEVCHRRVHTQLEKKTKTKPSSQNIWNAKLNSPKNISPSHLSDGILFNLFQYQYIIQEKLSFPFQSHACDNLRGPTKINLSLIKEWVWQRTICSSPPCV